MAACGMMPVAIRHPRLPSLHPGRSTLLHCGMVFAVCTVSQTLVWSDQFPLAVNSSARLDDRLFAVEVLVVLAPQLFTPYLWLCTSTFRKILQDFAKYEALHASIATAPLAPHWVGRRRRVARLVVCAFFAFTAFVSVAVTFLQAATGSVMLQLSYSYLPAAVSSLMMQFLVTLFFATHHFQMWEAAKAICAELHQIPVMSGRADSGAGEQDKQAGLRAIRDGHRLWVALRTLYNRTDYCFMDVFQLIHLFLSLLLGMYMFFVYVTSGILFNAVIEILFSAVILLQLGVITNGAHFGTQQMCGPVVDVLDKLSLGADDPQLFETVSLFYQSVVAFPAAVSLGGFTVVGRPLFTSVISATVTYMVIMMQFQQGVEDALQPNASSVESSIQTNQKLLNK
ncbi:gustatory and odorant receptor 24-like [Thrips palmi]|uniref:Gustatory receptor n=1 Tax=Thrips palmi TaxID=161013 RepID=A0A6P8YRS5_THRPL|nr:gustatory and odorant receptor 24-like [Thrips palmi]